MDFEKWKEFSLQKWALSEVRHKTFQMEMEVYLNRVDQLLGAARRENAGEAPQDLNAMLKVVEDLLRRDGRTS